MRINHCSMLIALITLVGLGAYAETSLSVDEAVELAIKNNLSLQRSKLFSDAKKRASDRSWNELLPSVSVYSSSTHTATSEIADPEWTPGAGLSVSVSLSPSIVANMKKAQLDYEAGLISYDTAKRELELDVRKAFYDILLYSEKVDLARQNIETAQSQYDQTKALARVGQASQLDALSAQVDLENLKPTLQRAIVSYQDALDELKQLIGISLEETIQLVGGLDDAAKINSLPQVERTTSSSDVKTLEKELEIAKAEKKATSDSAYLPTLSLSVTDYEGYAMDEWTNTGTFTAKLSLPLDGFFPSSSTRETLDEYDDTIASLSNQIAEAKQESNLTVRQLKRSIEKSIEAIRVLKLNVELSEKTYKQFEEAYKKGSSDLQSLKTAADSLQEARLNVMEESFTLLSALLDLEQELNVPFGTIGRE